MNPLELPKNCKPCIRVDTNDQSVGYSVGLPLGIRHILDKYSFAYSFQLMCDLQDNLDYSWELFVDSIYCNPAMFPTEMNNQTFTSVMHIDTTEEEFTSNDANRLPDDVKEVLDGCEWYYDYELPTRLAPFVSPTFRLVVDGEEYEPLETNDKGGKQSVIQGRYDLLPALAVEDIAVILQRGATKYGDNNWRKIPSIQHVNHAMQHLFQYLLYQKHEDLTHAACRLLMAIEVVYDRA